MSQSANRNKSCWSLTICPSVTKLSHSECLSVCWRECFCPWQGLTLGLTPLVMSQTARASSTGWLHLSVGVYHSCASLTVFVSPTTVQCFSWYEWDILFLSHKFEHNGQILITYQDLFHARDELFLHLAQVCANALSSRGVRIRRWDVTFGLLSRAKDTPSTLHLGET